ncbi:MAG TPA: peptidylprolyl isomerase [Myxococcales bacterium]|nr:peptidylprolyl isomerase [Myxococcales bacterium]
MGVAFCWAAAALLLCACARKKAPPAAPAPAVAVVDGVPIPVSALQRELDRARRGAGSQVVDGFPTPSKIESKDLPRLARALLDPLIDRVLLVQRAKLAGVVVTDAEVQSAMDALAETARASGETFADRLAQDGQTAEQFADDMRERLLAEKWVAEQTRGERPSPAEVRAWFDQHRSELDVKEEVHAQQILVATAEEAKSLLDQIRAGAPFEQLARSHGRSPDAQRGGDLGWFARGTMPKPFDDACFALKPGQVSGVVQTSYGYHLFKLLGRRGPRQRKLEEVKEEVARRAFAEKQAQAERQLLEQVRKSAKVEIDEAAFSLLR